jgi:hypothetical protein
VETCDKPSVTRGWCGAHYWKWRKYGDPLGSHDPYFGGLKADGCTVESMVASS